MSKNAAPILAAFVALGAAAFAFYRSQHLGPPPLEPVKKLWVTAVLQGVIPIDFKTGHGHTPLKTGLLPHNMLLSPDGKKLYVTNVGSQCVSEIDVDTEKKLKDILVGEIPDNPYHQKLGDRMKNVNSCYGCHEYQAVGSLPNALAWDGEGKHLIVNEVRKRRVTWLDPVAGKTMRSISFADELANSTPANIAVDPNTKEVWVLHRFEKSDYKKGPLGASSMKDFEHDPPAGQHVTYVTVHDPQMTKELARIRTEWAVPFAAVFSPDGKWLYAAYRSTNKIAVFDVAKRAIARTMDTSVAPTGLALSADGTEIYTSCLFSDPPVVQVLDVATGQVKASLGVPPSPSLVVTDPLTGLIYATATGYNAVLEIDPRAKKLLREIPAGHQPLAVVLSR